MPVKLIRACKHVTREIFDKNVSLITPHYARVVNRLVGKILTYFMNSVFRGNHACMQDKAHQLYDVI